MKKSLLALALVASAASAQACEAELTAIFDKLKPAAAFLASTQTGDHEAGMKIQNVSFKVHRLAPGIAAEASYGANQIRASTSLCDTSTANKQGVIAHEFGHLLSYTIFPKLKTKPFTSYAEAEAYADQWGAKVLREAKIDNQPYLNHLFKVCGETQHRTAYHCNAATNWLAGLSY